MERARREFLVRHPTNQCVRSPISTVAGVVDEDADLRAT